MTLTPGFEGPELELLLDIIPRVRKAASHEDDLITLLWEQEFAHLTYRYVEVAAEGGVPIDPSAEPGRWPVEAGEVVEDPRPPSKRRVSAAAADAALHARRQGKAARVGGARRR